MSGDRFRRARGAPGLHSLFRNSAFRWLLAPVWLAALVPAGAEAQPSVLTERRAIELALGRPAYRHLQEGRLASAEAAVAEAGLWPNPTVGWERSRTGGPGGDNTESTLVLSQTLDVSGRRALRREAAESRLGAARHDRRERETALVADVRRRFGEALHRDRTHAALEDWRRRIEAALQTVTRLAKSGEVSGYDRRRLEREARSAAARAAGTAADFARLRHALAGVTGDASAPLGGTLLPDEVPPLETMRAALAGRPDLASLDAQSIAYERELTAARRGWIPDVTVEVGRKRVEEMAFRSDGPVVGISVPVPLFDRGNAAAGRAQAQSAMLRAEQALARSAAEAELQGLWRQAMELRRVAAQLRAETQPESRELSRIAETAYRAGEGSLLELLDAYRAELDTELTALDLELRARMARIELDLLSGARTHE
jgi:cobalt-zinc-cadmium efflux system outer membrane protein